MNEHTVHLDIIKVLYSPTDAQVNCLKNNIKIDIKTAPTCFCSVTPSSGSACGCSHITTHRCILIGYFNNCNLAITNNALPDDGVNAPKHVGAVLTI